MMLGRGVRGVWGSCLRPPRPGVLAPDVDSKGLPFTEPLPYMKMDQNKSEVKKKKKKPNQQTEHITHRCLGGWEERGRQWGTNWAAVAKEATGTCVRGRAMVRVRPRNGVGESREGTGWGQGKGQNKSPTTTVREGELSDRERGEYLGAQVRKWMRTQNHRPRVTQAGA